VVRDAETHNSTSFPKDIDGPDDMLEMFDQQEREENARHEAKLRRIRENRNRWLNKPNGTGFHVVPNMFAGIGIKDAMLMFLNMRGGAAPLEEIVSVLTEGGCQMGVNALKNVSITVGAHKKIFRREESEVGDTISLVKRK